MNYQGVIMCAGTICLALVVCVFLILVGRKHQLSILNFYPFNYLEASPIKPAGHIVVSLLSVCFSVSYLLSFMVYKTPLALTGMIILMLSSLLIIPLILLNDNHLASNGVVSYCYFAGTFIGTLFAAISGVFDVQELGAPKFPLWLSIVLFVMAGIYFVLFLIPKLWQPRPYEKSEVNGKVIYVRSKVVLISVYQWGYILSMVLQMIVLLIANTQISLVPSI